MNNYIKNRYCMAIFLEYADGEIIKENIQYPQFFIEELNIYNVKKYHESMCKSGYLARNGIETTLTERGKEFLSSNRSLIDFFWEASTTITLNEFIKHVEKNKLGYMMNEEEFLDTLISILKKKFKRFKEKSEGNYESLLNTVLDLAKYYRKKVDLESAYAYYLMALYYQTSGVKHYEDIVNCINGEDSFDRLLNVYSNQYINHNILENILALCNEFDEDLVSDIFVNTKTRINLFSKDEFLDLVRCISKGEYSIKDYIEVSKKKYMSIIEKAKQL